jgi:hypothetical protein
VNVVAATPRASPADTNAATAGRRLTTATGRRLTTATGRRLTTATGRRLTTATGHRFTTARDRPFAARFRPAGSPWSRVARSLRFRRVGPSRLGGACLQRGSGLSGRQFDAVPACRVTTAWGRPFAARCGPAGSLRSRVGRLPRFRSAGRHGLGSAVCRAVRARRFASVSGRPFAAVPVRRASRLGVGRSPCGSAPLVHFALGLPVRWGSGPSGSPRLGVGRLPRGSDPSGQHRFGRPFAAVPVGRAATVSGRPVHHLATVSGPAASGSVGGRPAPGRPGFPRPPARSRG